MARDEVLWTRLSGEARAIAGRVPVSLVVHDIKELNHEIRTGQYFFSDVVSEGVLLHDSKRFMLARPKAQTPAERLELARLHEQRGAHDEARRLWQRIVDEYPIGGAAADARRLLGA